MMKKLGIVVMAGLFTVSVAGLSFADEKGYSAAPAPAAANPCAGKEMKKDEKKKRAAKKADKKAAETPAAPAAAPATEKK
ncbi:MAG: histone [Candidatus Methylomirabilota bacterium]|nr:histone [Candidatus Methylomirabilis sp.]PWB45844.1 MAG: histone [candidate division NC10 bacterium]